MNASERETKLHGNVESLLEELARLAQHPGTTSEQLFDQSTDILRLLFHPDTAAVILFGVNGLEINATACVSVPQDCFCREVSLKELVTDHCKDCLLYTSPSPRD